MSDLFESTPKRFEDFSLHASGILLDYSKNLIDETTRTALCALAEGKNLSSKIKRVFGHVQEATSSVSLHTALRALNDVPVYHKGINVKPDIRQHFLKMKTTVENIHSGKVLQKPLKTVLHVGIGGSDLGPRMVYEALQGPASHAHTTHFINTPDELTSLLETLDPHATLVILASLSFTTKEFLMNARRLRTWFEERVSARYLQTIFFAATAHTEAALRFGIAQDNILPVGPWLCGRFSVWSSMGCVLALTFGMKAFLAFLEGARSMDEHFKTAPFEENMPVIMALLECWYIRNFEAHALAVCPYHPRLTLFVAHLQQISMESLGKSLKEDGTPVNTQTGSVIFGGDGLSSQHSFTQLLFQGTHFIPVDLLVVKEGFQDASLNRFVHLSALAQSQALMEGHLSNHQAASLSRNVPSNTLILDRLAPFSLGALIALYEHKIFTQSVMWSINPFDQWGVEHGKHLHTQLSTDPSLCHGSTRGLLETLGYKI